MAGRYEKELSIKKDSFEFIDKSARAMLLNILRGVVIETPRDRGLAGANWKVTDFHPSDEVNGRYSSRNNAIKRGSVVIKGFTVTDRNDFIYIQNHVPYIERLNLGWSKQAGSFYVDKIIARVVNG